MLLPETRYSYGYVLKDFVYNPKTQDGCFVDAVAVQKRVKGESPYQQSGISPKTDKNLGCDPHNEFVKRS